MTSAADPEFGDAPTGVPTVTPPRIIPAISPEAALGHRNIEAWISIVRSYQAKHPGHQVHLFFQDEPVKSLVWLFKIGRAVPPDEFKLSVRAPGGDVADVPKLRRLLAEAAGSDPDRYVPVEPHRVLELF